MIRVFEFLVLFLIPFGLGYGVRAWTGRTVSHEDDNLRDERDKAVVALRTTHSALRAALADPTLSPTTTIVLDDAKIAIAHALPTGELA